MADIILNIAKDFSRIPGARKPQEGSFSGQEFRNNFLVPKIKEAIEKKCKLIVILDGTAGLGTSFLEESFGGLIREDGFPLSLLNEILDFISEEDEEYKEEIKEYMECANEQENH